MFRNGFLQAEVPCRKGIRIAQGAQRNVMRSPVADAAHTLQSRNGFVKHRPRRHLQTALRSELRKLLNRAGACLRQTYRRDIGHCCSRKRLRSRKVMRDLRERRVDPVAEAPHETAGQGRGTGHADLLAKHGAHGELECIKSTGHAQARIFSNACCKQRVIAQVRIDDGRIRIQIELTTHARHQGHQHG